MTFAAGLLRPNGYTLSFDWLPNRQKCGRLRVEPMSEGLTVKPANAAAKYAFPDAKKTRTVASAGFLVVKQVI